MVLERTELEWTYEPTDFFEVPYRCSNSEYDLLVEDGHATATLRAAQNPINKQLQHSIEIRLSTIFAVRQLQVHRKSVLRGPRVRQHAAGRQNVIIEVGAADLVTVGTHADIILRDTLGNIVRDTRAERIAENTATLDSLAPKIEQSPTLQNCIASYSQSVNDPDNELVHLYEVRDALSKHYGGEERAWVALGITQPEWKRVGVLANAEPLEQGRHRGKHPTGRRAATIAELEEARGIVRRWIIAFAQTV